MSAAMIGADPDQLDQLAGSFERQAQALDAAAARVRAQIHGSSWRGGAASRFRQDWDSTHMPRLRTTSGSLRSAASNLRRQANEQRRASGIAGGASGGAGQGSSDRVGTRGGAAKGFSFADMVDFGVGAFLVGNEVAGLVFDGLENANKLSIHPYASAVMKGIGLGSAAAGLATAIRDRDLSGGMVAVVDGAVTFAAFGPNAIYTGLKAEIGFFIPLTAAEQQEHLAWMTSQGYSESEVVKRYTGVQGFIDLGNDNAERKAPWMNDVADQVMEKPAEWLYHAGIRL